MQVGHVEGEVVEGEDGVDRGGGGDVDQHEEGYDCEDEAEGVEGDAEGGVAGMSEVSERDIEGMYSAARLLTRARRSPGKADRGHARRPMSSERRTQATRTMRRGRSSRA